MAFNIANLTTGTPGFHSDFPLVVWDYTTSDTVSTVEDEDGNGNTYFRSSFKTFRNYDVIRVTATDGKGIYFISGISPGSGGVLVLTKLATVTSF